ncbi:hypothetical protein KA517_04155 [Candidatus Gracilibacteria bacterium]|nr:hypothetical protein [Candidatus Gracilibacteria bacterium]
MPCADDSRHNHENFVGTASPVECWLLVTYPQPWGASAFLESTIPSAVKNHMQSIYQQTECSRIQVITQDSHEQLACYLAISQENRQQLFRFDLQSYEDILAISWEAVISKPEDYQHHLVNESLTLICTNTAHDPCCGQYGNALFEATKSRPQVWQTNHLGGDRFAANVVVLPQGIYYRRVSKDNLIAIQVATENQTYYLPNLGGRSYYDRHTQIAEQYLYTNQLTANTSPRWHLWQLVASESQGEGQSVITFADAQKKLYHVQVTKRTTDQKALLNCHATQPESLSTFDCKLQ